MPALKTSPEDKPIPVRPCLNELLDSATTRLAPHSSSARLDAELLLSHCLGKTRSFLMAWPEHRPQLVQLDNFTGLLQRRLCGEPVAHLIEEREFWSLSLRVTPATLIPRPETEHLVEQALTHIPTDQRLDIVDLGTGSGAIAIAIAHERPCCRITAIDHSPDALDIASDNAGRHGLNNICFRYGNWLDGDTSRYDVIVANPPYIRNGDPHLQEDGLPFEPLSALVAGNDGLDAIRTITRQAREHLNCGGWLLFEHGYDQQTAVIELLQQTGYINVTGLQDLSSIDRIVAAQWKAK